MRQIWTMNRFLTDLYLLLTAYVPIPRNTMIFALMTLIAYSLFVPHYSAFTEAGLILPVLCAVFGYVTVVSLNAPVTVKRLREINANRVGPRTFLVPFTICAFAIFAPSLSWAQHTISVVLGITALASFILVYGDFVPATDSSVRVEARRNATNWHITRLVALLLGNEIVARTGTPTDWVIAMCLGPIALHYLMYWTIIATHPYETGQQRNLDD